MAPRFRRRSKEGGSDDEDDPDGAVHLSDDAHAWWAQRPVEEVWRPRDDPPPTEAEEPERDVLAEHFGADWRTSFGFQPPPPDDPLPDDEPADLGDPYAVLGVASTATWEEIVEAHRSMARRHHPDRLVGQSPARIAAGEDRIRAINSAYAELKVRRGR